MAENGAVYIRTGDEAERYRENAMENLRKLRARQEQVGGSHYKDMAIQPADYILQNKLGWAEGCAIAYISRWRQKGGIEDLEKAIHTLRLLIDAERA